jgi:hypothetical protein
MKKILISIITLLILTVPFAASIKADNNLATVINPDTLHRKTVKIGDPDAFKDGYVLETSYGFVEEDRLGFSVATGYDRRLTRSISSTASTIYVTNTKSEDNVQLTMADFGTKVFLTIEPTGAKKEIVMCTGITTTAWTGCTRGLAFYGTSTVAVDANKQTHSAGSQIIMSNVHYIFEQLIDIDTDQTLAGNTTFTGTVTIPAPTLDSHAATKYYVDNTAFAGFGTSTEATAGGGYLATQDNMFDGFYNADEPRLLHTRYTSASSSNTLSDSYYVASPNISNSFGGGMTDNAIGQAFSPKINGTINRVLVSLLAVGNITGNATVKIYGTTGTYGTSAIPTGDALATSDNINVSTISSSTASLVTFNFSGANKISLANATKYALAVEYTGGDSSNYLRARSYLPGTHSGNISSRARATSVWTAVSSHDLIFYAYQDSGITIPITNASGKLDQSFLDLTQSYSWSGAHTHTATSTFSNTALFTGGAFGAGYANVQVFTSSGTWTKPAGVSKIMVEVVGGGGNGGSNNAGTNYGTGGGGGGGYGKEIIDVSATSSVTVTVGAAGQASSFGTYCSASAGSVGESGGFMMDGGAGGVGSGCDINIKGQGGGFGTDQDSRRTGGMGGSSQLGGGGAGLSTSAADQNGNAGGNYGGGGSGCTAHSGSGCNGGAGAPGIVIVYY